MQTVSTGDNLHEMSKSCFLGKNERNISNCGLILPRVLSIKEPFFFLLFFFLIDKDIFAFQSDIKSLLKIYIG